MALNKLQKIDLGNELAKRNYLESLVAEKMHIEKKNQYRNLSRFMNQQRREQEEEQEFEKSLMVTAQKEAHVHQEERLAVELDKLKRKEIVEIKRRQQLYKNSHELKDLERKLRTAYMSKELCTQLAEKEAEKLNRKLQEKQANEILHRAHVQEAEIMKIRAAEDIKKKALYKAELQTQIIANEHKKRAQYEDLLIQKKMIDDVIEKIHDENQREIEEKRCRVQKTREEMEKFKEAQQIWKQKRRNELEEEDRKNQEYMLYKVSDENAKKMAKEAKEAAREKIIEQISMKLYENQRKHLERQEVMQELLEEEEKEAAEIKYRQEVEQKLRSTKETYEIITQQLAEREKALKKEAEQDALFREQMMVKIAEDEKLEQLSAEKKRLKLIQLRKDVAELVADRRRKRAEEMQLVIRLRQEQKKEKEERHKIIEAERIKILQEHAKNLIGYFPKGLIREDDLPLLGSEFVEAYSKKT